MTIEENVNLKKYNTFGLGYTADRIIHLDTEAEASALIKEHPWKDPFLILGGGSNLLFTSNFNGTLLRPGMEGIRVESMNNNKVIISAGSGVNWDNLVEWTVENGLYGLENLSLIPGNTGASPVQNIGAYGAEVKDTIERVETIRINDGAMVTFGKNDCGFSYRYSIFKGDEKGKYLVTRVFFSLKKESKLNLDYGSLKEEIRNLGSETLRNARQAVINIRRRKLPDPDIIGNAGSFFKNPVVAEPLAARLKIEYPLMPFFIEKPGSVKLAAGWLIEQCGWKGKRIGDAGVHEKQALVLVNHGNAQGKDIYMLSESIRLSVQAKFGIALEREVEVVGTI